MMKSNYEHTYVYIYILYKFYKIEGKEKEGKG